MAVHGGSPPLSPRSRKTVWCSPGLGAISVTSAIPASAHRVDSLWFAACVYFRRYLIAG